jgi:predicted short-subunit dehydrogenase-like oxidoreductase (DUF2520 family)
MKVVLIGSGNVASHLGLAIKNAGIDVVQVFSPNLDHATILAQNIGAEPINNFDKLNLKADLYVISVKDDAIESIAKQLKMVKGLVVHTAGTVSLNAVKNFTQKSGVLYPLQTFSKSKLVDFKQIPLFLEASDSDSLNLLKNLANKISDKVYEIDGDKRKILHLSAVFACNFTNHLYALADDILVENGLSFDMIKPLIIETTNKILVNKPVNVQTGPAIRNDENTMEAQKNLLKNNPTLLNIYQVLSDSIKLTIK